MVLLNSLVAGIGLLGDLNKFRYSHLEMLSTILYYG